MWGGRIGILLPGKEGAKMKMLHYWELGEDFGIEHLDHALVFRQ